MNVIRNASLAALLGVLALSTLAGCNRRQADVPTSTTPATEATPTTPTQPPASAASQMGQ